MHPILKESLFVFVIVVVSNIIVDLDGEEQRFLSNPIRFFGLSLLLSFVAGLLVHAVKKRSRRADDQMPMS